MAHDGLLHLDGRDVLAPRDDDVLLPVSQLDVAVGVPDSEIPVERLEGKAKLSQNRDATDRAGTIAGLRAAGDPWSAAVADLMAAREAGAGRSGA